MAYIIAVNPQILGAAGVPKGAAMTATCLSAAAASILMGVWARLPVALAPWDGDQRLLRLLRVREPRHPLADTVATLVAVAERGGLMTRLPDGRRRLPRATAALASDAVGTLVGALLGTSTVTSDVESTSGIAAGGRSGLTAVVVGLAIPFTFSISDGLAVGFVLYPLAKLLGGRAPEVSPLTAAIALVFLLRWLVL